MSISLPVALRQARRGARLSQQALASRAGLSRMTVQKLEAGDIDPRLSTLTVVMRVLGLEVVLVPSDLTPAVETFLRAGGRLVAQPPGTDAPLSIVEWLTDAGAGARAKSGPGASSTPAAPPTRRAVAPRRTAKRGRA
ncbi:MAG: helix-turn-helix domain-containing protein [Myxococcales bacterium]|nr:helix-turn-helix domain-containing protein [Myxococcales bacterium]